MKSHVFRVFVLGAALLVFPSLNAFSDVGLPDIETAFLNKDYEGARSLALTFLANPHSDAQVSEARYYLGMSRLYLDDSAGARQEFEKVASEAVSRSLKDRARLGVIDSHLLAGEYEDALVKAKRLLRQSSGSEFLSLVYLKAARADLKLTNWADARVYLEKIIREFPDSLEAHLARQLLAEKQFFAVQVGSFVERERAEKLVEDLRVLGEYAYIVETSDYSGRRFYRVRVGQASSLPQAESLKQKLTRYGYPTRIYP